MKQQPSTTSTTTRGFTLLEVLMAMGVFAIGFVFIAAIFPVAALLQKEAVDEVNAQQASRNTLALIAAMEANYTADLDGNLKTLVSGSGGFPQDQRVYALKNAAYNSAQWSSYIRSYPTSIPTATQRKFFWVPLVRDTNPDSGVNPNEIYTYVFILQKRNGAIYPDPSTLLPSGTICANSNDDPSIPKVYAAKVLAVSNNTIKFKDTNFNGTGDTPTQLDVGDQFLDNNGIPYTITDYDLSANTITIDGILLPVPNAIDTIWFASPGEDADTPGYPSGKSSPTMDIKILTGVIN